jgi:phosphoglycolate phosphatase
MTSGIVLFDLDGTLVDPAGAITGGIAGALEAHGVEVPSDEVLRGFVGPPLAASLQALPGVTEDLVPRLITHYRDGYRQHGMAASRVYPGVSELLVELREAGCALAVATSKPEPIAMRLLEVQGIASLFDVISGSDPDDAAPHPGKDAIIASALDRLALPGWDAVMVGDRHFDVDGATRCGIPCIGVSWGYAPDGELVEAGAEVVVDTAEELREAIDDALGRDG